MKTTKKIEKKLKKIKPNCLKKKLTRNLTANFGSLVDGLR